jgi:hypothetical protein
MFIIIIYHDTITTTLLSLFVSIIVIIMIDTGVVMVVNIIPSPVRIFVSIDFDREGE